LTTYELVKDWLTNSGICILDESNTNRGAVHSFYDEKKNEYAFLYPEITGYFASTMRFLYEHENDKKFIELAKSSGNWIIDLYEKYGGIIQGISNDGIAQKSVYSFDTGICSNGLIDCYKISKEEKFLEYAKKLNQWILDYTIEPNGFVKPLKNLETNQFEEDNKVWYKRSGCLHIKLAIPLLKMYKITHEKSFLDASTKICNTITKFQKSDGSISLHFNDEIINLHTLCYALEGLIHAYDVTKDPKYLLCCQNAIKWCDQQIQEDGSMDVWFNSKYHSKSSYPIAQIIRLKILLAKIGNLNLDKRIDILKSFLLSLQAENSDVKINGGFYEEFHKSIFGWKKTYRINSWASMFSLQALFWIENYSKINFSSEIDMLY